MKGLGAIFLQVCPTKTSTVAAKHTGLYDMPVAFLSYYVSVAEHIIIENYKYRTELNVLHTEKKIWKVWIDHTISLPRMQEILQQVISNWTIQQPFNITKYNENGSQWSAI